jgi:uncharacterized protein (TIGR00255 family)
MIKGMTGFGSAELSTADLKITTEIKSVNHRYLDVNFYLPSGFNLVENKIRQLVQKKLARGKVTVSVKVVQKNPQAIILNKAILKKHIEYAKSMSKEFHIENDLRLSDLIKLPGVLETKEYTVTPEDEWPFIEKCLIKAVDSLSAMRISEGKSLFQDVKKSLGSMSLQIRNIKTRIKFIAKSKKKELATEEFLSWQKGADINEELARLAHYIDEVTTLLKNNVDVGKKIDFVAQEMQRESNTIGSKVQDKLVSSAVISLKNQVEKIREQAQNIE